MKYKLLRHYLQVVFVVACFFGGKVDAALPVVITNTLPVTAVEVVGNRVTFKAAFSGTGPITYQWQVIGGGTTNDIPGATNTMLTLSNLQLTNTASYRLQASNVTGVASSTASSLTVNPVPGPVNNIITAFAAQTGLGSTATNFVPTWTVAPGSLITGQAPSSVGNGNFSDPYDNIAGTVAVLTDGTYGWLNYWPNVGSSTSEVTCGTVAGGAGESVTYTLLGSVSGFSLTNITVYGGWGDVGRDQQAYTVYYSTFAAPTNFIPLISVNYNPPNPANVQSATRATLTSASGSLATNVAAVKFDFTTPPVENGYSGYSEIQIFGNPTGSAPTAGLPTSSPNSPVNAGTLVTFNEAASGVPPLQYQWQSDNGNGGVSYADIAGATGSNYVLNTTNFGNFTLNFRVRVSDINGSTTSPVRQLVVTNANTYLSAATVGSLCCEHLKDPLGLDVSEPRLSWTMSSTQRGNRQTAYQVLVASSPTILSQDQGNLWNSGAVVSDQSVLVRYAGQSLTSGRMCYWKVRVWDAQGNPSAWSSTALWSMGLLNISDWSAQWIGMNENTNISPAPPSPMLRKTFSISKPLARATAYICGLGYYELQINGVKVGDYVLEPAWTLYNDHAYYTTYDVTTNLLQGPNAVGVQLANGYYNQWTSDAWNTASARWRALPQMIMKLDVEYTDGTSNVVVSDSSWKASAGPLLLDTTRLGEVYDARLEQPGWSTASYNDSAWTNAILREGTAGLLTAPDAEPVKVCQTIYPTRIIPVLGQPGVYTFDFGQNLVGWGQLTVSGPAGTSVSMVYGELTNSDASVNQDNINVYVNLKNYFQTDTYILKGSGTEIYAPRFTYHGFRYAQVSGLPSAPTTNTLVAQVVHTAFDSAGKFLCSSDLLNRIETNTLWSYLGNFVGIPTDCPQREKNGWTGDAQLACEIGLTHFHSEAAYTRWIKEFAPGQQANGVLSGVFPNAGWGYAEGPAWESAYLLIPWFVYQHCGDVAILTNNYAGMKAYVDYETSVASGNIVSYGLGDWEPANTVTPVSVTDTAYYYQDALILAQTAALMGNTSDSLQYSNLAAQIKVSFNSSFFNSTNSKYAGGTQTAQSCALYQGMVATNQISAVVNTLATSIQQNNNNIDTGILGSKYLLRALCDNGRSDTALALATQTSYPSWGYQVASGATTLWETWSGTGSIDSFNHVMFGDISAWFIEYVAGIRPGAPGYKSVIIKPEVMNGLAWAQATHDSPYGTISSAWQVTGLSANLNIAIPPGATATVYLPMLATTMTNVVIQESGVTIWQNGAVANTDPGMTFRDFESFFPQTYAVWTVASGNYNFTWQILVGAPSGLSAAAGNEQVNLSWSPVAGATGYRVKRSTIKGGSYTTVASLTGNNYTDTGLVNGTSYYYVVCAVSSSGEGPNSVEVNAIPAFAVNLGFETPGIDSYQYDPFSASWIYNGGSGNGSGLIANGSGFSNPDAPEGVQAAFVQSYGSISQILSGFTPGTSYTITYSAAQRAGGNQHGGESWNVMIDNTVIKTNSPGGSSYVDYTASFIASATAHKLAFVGTDLATGDNTVFLDNVRISPPIQPASASVALTSPVNNSSFATPSTINLAATVATNGNLINAVQFYVNVTNLIGQDTSPPYIYTWTNVAPGNYILSARVNFNDNRYVDSTVANIVVSNLPPVIQSIGFTANSFYLGGTGQAGQTFVLMSASNLIPPISWTPLMTNQADSSGRFVFTNLPATNPQQFYRVFVP
jgi:alpha-L-rhamnosidase